MAEECVLLDGDVSRDRIEQRIVEYSCRRDMQPLARTPESRCGELGLALGGELATDALACDGIDAWVQPTPDAVAQSQLSASQLSVQ